MSLINTSPGLIRRRNTAHRYSFILIVSWTYLIGQHIVLLDDVTCSNSRLTYVTETAEFSDVV